VLGKISLTTNPGGIIALQPSENTHSALVSVSHIKTISIRMTDERIAVGVPRRVLGAPPRSYSRYYQDI
jgi:hypothetical protein